MTIRVTRRRPYRHKPESTAMPPKRAPNKKNDSAKKEFVWSDDEAELLLSVTHEYKTQHLVNGTCWESVKSKYTDILELMRKELPANEEEASRIFNKEYPHKPEEVTKEILTTKLKAIKKKFREVWISCVFYYIITEVETFIGSRFR